MENQEKNEVLSRAVKAGKRTYFFDVKSTRSEELYLTITESKRKFNEETGTFFYEKHKIFLYKEDFAHFTEGLQDVIAYVQAQVGNIEARPEWTPEAKEETPVEKEEPKKKGLFGIFK